MEGTVYMGQLATDPLNSGDYVYSYTMTENSENFELTTLLENLSDEAIDEAQTKCDYTPPAGLEAMYIVCAD